MILRLAAALALVLGVPPSTAGASPPPIMDPTSMAAARVGAPPDAPAGSLVLRGLAGQTETLSAADVAKLAHEPVSVVHDDKTVTYSGPDVADLLRDVGAPFGNKLHGQGVNDVVFVTGRDRYRVVLTLPEVDASFHKGAHVILADQADGKPLDAHDGPYRLVVDGDLKPSRSVRGVVLIEIRRLP